MTNIFFRLNLITIILWLQMYNITLNFPNQKQMSKYSADSRVVRSVHPLLNEEALRLVREMPHWIPGKKRGKAVRVSQTLPIEFKLD